LRQILSQLPVAHHPKEQREERPLVPPDEFPVRGLLARAGQDDDFLISLGRQINPRRHARPSRLRSGFLAGYIELLC